MSHDVQDLDKIVLSQKGKHFDTSNERESEQRETALSKSTSVDYHPNVESKSKSALLKVMKFCAKSRILLIMTTKKKILHNRGVIRKIQTQKTANELYPK